MFARFILALSAAVVLAAGAQAQGGKTFPQSKSFGSVKPQPIFVPPVYRPPVYRPPVYRPPFFPPPVFVPPVYKSPFFPPYYPYFPKNPWYGW